MRDGYCRFVKMPGGYGIKLIPPVDGGRKLRLAEVEDYLERQQIAVSADLHAALGQALAEPQEKVCWIAGTDCPVINEDYQLNVASDGMSARVRFIPPSETGKRLTLEDFLKDLRFRNVVSGIQMDVLQEHFQSEGLYGMYLEAAKGKEPRQGKDAQIEYFFNTDLRAKPTMNEDGSVDFFHLNMVNHCKKGDMLAKIIPADEGDYGMNIMGSQIKPRDVKKVFFKFGNNIQVSEDRLSLVSLVDGHVTLVDGQVFVSDVYEVENVDNSTGNIDFQGSVQINGNVASNFSVNASGNVIIKGVVEGAHIQAGGNIIIARGMNGMGKGTLKAGGNIAAKFLESANAEADGYVSTEAIMHSVVKAGTEVTVSGRRGFIVGGHVQAKNRITVKTLGAEMGASTIVEVGASPQVKSEYARLQKDVMEVVKTIRQSQPIIADFGAKRARGVKFSPSQLEYVKSVAQTLEKGKKELEEKNARLQELQKEFDPDVKAQVLVQGVAYPGVTVIIGDVSMIVGSSYKYCRFEKRDGDVKMAPL